jgi:uncharacterized BrkB/YihY/UPF0761 family membrane protein
MIYLFVYLLIGVLISGLIIRPFPMLTLMLEDWRALPNMILLWPVMVLIVVFLNRERRKWSKKR